MSAPTFVIPAVAALFFTLGGYLITHAKHDYADDIGEMLWTILLLGSFLLVVKILDVFATPRVKRRADDMDWSFAAHFGDGIDHILLPDYAWSYLPL